MQRSPAPAARRVHIVLIPGFAGFDALGQLEYYAGVTPQFCRWQQQSDHHSEAAVLHYFDNFPTAAVVTRAARLRSYLAKRVVRGEFLPGDRIALVGHSTGGLDIRRLLWDLEVDSTHDQYYALDGAQDVQFKVRANDLLTMITRVVFLSVPQLGTNIADWVRAYTLARELVVADLRLSVGASQLPLVDRIQSWVANGAAAMAHVDLLYAIQDALSEAQVPAGTNATTAALAQEAAAELGLWLRHIATDFRAIDDLAAEPPAGDCVSPAHFTPDMRRQERARWKRRGIRTKSYATIGTRPFRFEPGEPAPRWDFLKLHTYPEFTPTEPAAAATDIVYRYCYRACAGGPFTKRASARTPTPEPLLDTSRELKRIELWDNDGIVNTASMMWPDGKETLLVEGDHMDIVGHYELVPIVCKERGRKYQAYDLLQSGSAFNAVTFERVWADTFDFCVSG